MKMTVRYHDADAKRNETSILKNPNEVLCLDCNKVLTERYPDTGAHVEIKEGKHNGHQIVMMDAQNAITILRVMA